MYNLLLVDDEVLTREHIMDKIPWPELGIGIVRDADDGLNALEVIHKGFKPEIVLTDLRMPHMDGVELSFSIKELLPDCKIIFMSGFSDVEYLKSAIELHVVNYVEKPLDLDELKSALLNAVREYEKDSHLRLFEDTVQNSIPFFKNEIALQLIRPQYDASLIANWMALTDIQLPPRIHCKTLLVNIIQSRVSSDPGISGVLTLLENRFSLLFSTKGLSGIWAKRREDQLIIHLIADSQEKDLLSIHHTGTLCTNLAGLLEDVCGKFFISSGRLVSDIKEIPESYRTAEQSMNLSFYYGYNSIVEYKERINNRFSFHDDQLNDFSDLLYKPFKGPAIDFVKKATMEVRCFDAERINAIKGIYYKMLLQIFRIEKEMGIEIEGHDENHLRELFAQFHILKEYEELTIQVLNDFYSHIEDVKSGKSIISEIVRFIHSHYSENTLTIKRISDHTFMNVNYLCYLFKKETGKTINQFITEYRIERASELLKDKRMKISDIAERVGYKDGTYFAKIFKKTTRLSPSEYREQVQE